MKDATYFSLVFCATIVVTRIFLYWRPMETPKILSFRPHHWMTGIVLAAFDTMFASPTLYAIVLGLLS